ncbi:hypothetical protein [uncultured Paludibaculum sp.]|uniref:hypothetical protein n=1 Tax=uncultured Paludibaculum sp. TaxID=1765020 RepID=UPI002AAA6326|nr:hypothetical protein [uncultured Paludibaculum sp.]
MSLRFLDQVRTAISRINPNEIRQSAERPVRVLMLGSSSAFYAQLEDFLAPANVSREKRMEIARTLTRSGDADPDGRYHLIIAEPGTPVPEGWDLNKDAFLFDPAHPKRLVHNVIENFDEATLPMARLFPPFRQAAIDKTIYTVSKENALFSILTALPNIIPSLAELPWMVGEFASDTAVLTTNQIRMAFLLAAASDRAVGFREQRSEIGSIVAGAWGWRAAARELVGKIPFGGGIIPKAAIAYAGTYVVGLSLERVYRVGYGLTRAERAEAYEAALAKGKEVAAGLLDRVRRK